MSSVSSCMVGDVLPVFVSIRLMSSTCILPPLGKIYNSSANYLTIENGKSCVEQGAGPVVQVSIPTQRIAKRLDSRLGDFSFWALGYIFVC